MKKLIIILGLAIFGISCQTIHKKWSRSLLRNKKLTWKRHANPKSDLAGFRVYLGEKGPRKDKILKEIMNPTATAISLANLEEFLDHRKANHIYLTAFDRNGNESKPSEKTCWGRGCKKEKKK